MTVEEGESKLPLDRTGFRQRTPATRGLRKSSYDGQVSDLALRMGIALVLLLALGACSRAVSIDDAVASGDGLDVTFSILACLGDHEIEHIEGPETVVVRVIDRSLRSPFGGGDCLDGGSIRLEQPLGERPLVDDRTGDVVEVRYEPWNQYRFTEAEYRAGVEAAVACVLEADPTVDARVVERTEGPYPEVNIPDLPDGGSFDGRFIGDCIDEHIEPLRR